MGIGKAVLGTLALAVAAAGGAYMNELTHKYDDDDDDDDDEFINFYDVIDFVRNANDDDVDSDD